MPAALDQHRLLWLALALLAASTAAAHEDARGPEPIRASELARYGDLLGLSDEQRFAVEGVYDTYIDEYEPLRWEIIDLAVRHPRGRVIRRGDEEEFTRRLPGFVGRAGALDESFFTGIEPLLTDSQRQSLPRLRLMRERSIYAGLDAVKRFIGDGIPDLSATVDGLEFDPEAIASHRAAMLTYEDRLTRGLRGVFEAVVRLCGEGDPAAAEVLVERVRSLRSMNRQMYDTLRDGLPHDAARRLREEFFVHAYGDMLFTARCYVQPECEAALALPDLKPAEREVILQIQQQAIKHQDQALEALADAVDAMAIYVGGFDPRRGDPMAPSQQAHTELLNATMREMERRHREASRELARILGAERERAIRRPAEYNHRSGQTSMKACGIVAASTRLHRPSPAMAGSNRRASNALLPDPIGAGDLREIIILLDLNDHDREVLQGIHADYEQELSAYFRSVRDAQFRLRGVSMANLTWQERDAAFAERARALQALRAEARTAVEEADSQFFQAARDELTLTVDDPRLVRARHLRSRTRLLASSMWPRHPNLSGEFDLVSLLVQQRLSDEDWTLIEEHVAHDEQRMAELLRAQFDTIYEAHEPRPEGPQPHLEIMRRPEAMHDAHAAVAMFNQDMIVRLAEALPPHRASSLLDSFNRMAFPLAFADTGNMDSVMRQVVVLPNLSAAARDEATAIRNDFAAAYEDVQRRIIDLCAGYEPYLLLEGISIRSRPHDEEAFAQSFGVLSDRRAAINRRALRGLRTILTPAQLRRLDLPAVE